MLNELHSSFDDLFIFISSTSKIFKYSLKSEIVVTKIRFFKKIKTFNYSSLIQNFNDDSRYFIEKTSSTIWWTKNIFNFVESNNKSSRSNIKFTKTFVEKTIFNRFLKSMSKSLNSTMQIVIDVSTNNILQQLKKLLTKNKRHSFFDDRFNASIINVITNNDINRFVFKKLDFFDFIYEKKMFSTIFH